MQQAQAQTMFFSIALFLDKSGIKLFKAELVAILESLLFCTSRLTTNKTINANINTSSQIVQGYCQRAKSRSLNKIDDMFSIHFIYPIVLKMVSPSAFEISKNPIPINK